MKIKQLLFILGILCLMSFYKSCETNQFTNSKPDFISIKRTIKWHNINLTPDPFFEDEVNYIFYYKNYVVATRNVQYSYKTSDTSYSYPKQEYFIYKKNENQGYYFKDLNKAYIEKMNVDTFLKGSNFNNFPVDSLLKKSNILSVENEKNKTILHTVTKEKDCTNNYDTFTFYFRKDLPPNIYTLSSYEYGADKMKLYKLEAKLIGMNQLSKSIDGKTPVIEYIISEEPPTNRKEIIDFINKFDRTISK